MGVSNAIPGPDAHFISLDTGITMTTTYREEKENILNSNYANKGILPLSETYNRHLFDYLLGQDNCAGIRIYYGMDEDLKVHAVLVGVTETNEDILPLQSVSLVAGDDSPLGELGHRCPDICPPPSPLNP